MHRGLDALSWRADFDGRACFIRRLHEDDDSLPPFMACVRAAEGAGQAGLAPALLFYAEEQRLLVFEDVSDSHVAVLRPFMDMASNLDVCIDLLHRWHRDGTSQLPDQRLTTLSGLSVAMEDRARTSEDFREGLPVAWPVLTLLSGRVQERLAGSPGATVSLHGEVFLSNFLRPIGPGRLLMCDFDRSVIGDPAQDFAGLWLEVSSDHSDIEGFAKHVNVDAGRLGGWIVAEDLFWGVWAWEAHFQGRISGAEPFKYARFRLNRARMNAQRLGILSCAEAASW